MPETKDEAASRRAPANGTSYLRVAVSNALLPLVAGFGGVLGADAVRSEAADKRMDERIALQQLASRPALIEEMDKRYAPKDVTDAAWKGTTERMNEQLGMIRAELTQLREYTRDLPVMAATLKLMEKEGR